MRTVAFKQLPTGAHFTCCDGILWQRTARGALSLTGPWPNLEGDFFYPGEKVVTSAQTRRELRMSWLITLLGMLLAAWLLTKGWLK